MFPIIFYPGVKIQSDQCLVVWTQQEVLTDEQIANEPTISLKAASASKRDQHPGRPDNFGSHPLQAAWDTPVGKKKDTFSIIFLENQLKDLSREKKRQLLNDYEERYGKETSLFRETLAKLDTLN